MKREQSQYSGNSVEWPSLRDFLRKNDFVVSEDNDISIDIYKEGANISGPDYFMSRATFSKNGDFELVVNKDDEILDGSVRDYMEQGDHS